MIKYYFINIRFNFIISFIREARFLEAMFEQLFAYLMSVPPILALIFITLIPLLELRASIPYGILVLKMQWWWVFVICVIANILIGPLLYLLMDLFLKLLLKMRWFATLWTKMVERPRRKIHESVERWGEFGVAVFIGIPLPGTGVYSGAIGSYLLGLSHKKFFYATVLGVLMAAIIVTLVVLAGSGIAFWAVKTF